MKKLHIKGLVLLSVIALFIFINPINSFAKQVVNGPKINIKNCGIRLSKYLYYYDGKEHKPTVTVTYNGRTVSSSNYTLNYSHNKDVGRATVTVTAKQNTDYTGSDYRTFTICRTTPINTCKILLESSKFNYTGNRICPAVHVYYNKDALIKDVHYKLTYYNNVAPGIAKVSITGINKYTGTVTKTFTIEDPGRAILNAAKRIHDIQLSWSYSGEIKDLCFGDILKSINNPKKKTNAATYVSSVLYAAKAFSENKDDNARIINQYNYNHPKEVYNLLNAKGWKKITSYNQLRAGDIVFIKDNGNVYGHVQIYAGANSWYTAGTTESIQHPGVWKDSNWARSGFQFAMRRQ